jgi:hypothetical protein
MNRNALYRLFAVASAALVATFCSAQIPAEALSLRQDLVAAIVRAQESGVSALARLRQASNRSGLGVADDDADFAYAALDVALRLVGSQHAQAAQPFFVAAEQALAKVVQKTPDSDAEGKARHLATLAFVRSRFLHRDADARAALDAADKLQPGDPLLREMRARLSTGRGKYFLKLNPRG